MVKAVAMLEPASEVCEPLPAESVLENDRKGVRVSRQTSSVWHGMA